MWWLWITLWESFIIKPFKKSLDFDPAAKLLYGPDRLWMRLSISNKTSIAKRRWSFYVQERKKVKNWHFSVISSYFSAFLQWLLSRHIAKKWRSSGIQTRFFGIAVVRSLNSTDIFAKTDIRGSAVCCGVRGRTLASHTDVRGFEPQCGGRLSSLTCWQLCKYKKKKKKGGLSLFLFTRSTA